MPTEPESDTQDHPRPGAAHLRASPGRARVCPVVAVITGLFVLVTAGLLLWAEAPARVRYDQDGFHLPTIQTFSRQWPRPNLGDYLSATTPGYHLLLAGVHRFITESVTALRWVAWLFSLGLVVTFAWALVVAARPRDAPSPSACWAVMAAGLPLIASPYVLQSAVWLLPDNLGWWGVLAVVLLALRARVDAYFVATGAVLLLGLVLVRQIHLWTLGALLAAAWLGPRATPHDSWTPLLGRQEWGTLLGSWQGRVGRLSWVLLAATPSVLALAWLALRWGGLTPPGNLTPPLEGAEANFGRVSGGNAAMPAFILTLLGVYGIAYAAWWWPSCLDLLRRGRWVLIAAAVVGLLAAVIPPTGYDYDAGRWGGLWQIVERLPLLAGRTSPLILLLAPAGAVVAASLAHALSGRERWVWLASLAGFMAAMSATALAWQRYIEPMLLILIALACVRAAFNGGPATRPSPPGLWRILRVCGPSALAVGLAMVGLRGG